MIESLNGLAPIYKREVRSHLRSAGTYVALGLLLLVAGAIYHDLLALFVAETADMAKSIAAPEPPNINKAVIEQTFSFLTMVLIFIVPILSMRSIAAEKSSGTFEVLASCPVGDWGILLGKYFALLTLGVAVVGFSAAYPAATYWLGQSQGAAPEMSRVVGGLLGLFLIYSAYAAFGVMASSFTKSQPTAAIIAMIGLLVWNLSAEFPTGLPALQAALTELSAARHAESLLAGLVTLRDIAFYALASFACLFIASRMLESRRWRI